VRVRENAVPRAKRIPCVRSTAKMGLSIKYSILRKILHCRGIDCMRPATAEHSCTTTVQVVVSWYLDYNLAKFSSIVVSAIPRTSIPR
jgi:hypothetical protein